MPKPCPSPIHSPALRGPFVHHLAHGRGWRDRVDEGTVTEGIGHVSCCLIAVDARHRALRGFDDVRVRALVHDGFVPLFFFFVGDGQHDAEVFFCGGARKKVSTIADHSQKVQTKKERLYKYIYIYQKV